MKKISLLGLICLGAPGLLYGASTAVPQTQASTDRRITVIASYLIPTTGISPALRAELIKRESQYSTSSKLQKKTMYRVIKDKTEAATLIKEMEACLNGEGKKDQEDILSDIFTYMTDQKLFDKPEYVNSVARFYEKLAKTAENKKDSVAARIIRMIPPAEEKITMFIDPSGPVDERFSLEKTDTAMSLLEKEEIDEKFPGNFQRIADILSKFQFNAMPTVKSQDPASLINIVKNMSDNRILFLVYQLNLNGVNLNGIDFSKSNQTTKPADWDIGDEQLIRKELDTETKNALIQRYNEITAAEVCCVIL